MYYLSADGPSTKLRAGLRPNGLADTTLPKSQTSVNPLPIRWQTHPQLLPHAGDVSLHQLLGCFPGSYIFKPLDHCTKPSIAQHSCFVKGGLNLWAKGAKIG